MVRAKVFISYSRKDSDFTEYLAASLVDRGFDTFVDKEDIAPGEPWKERLAALIAAADTIVFVVSAASIISPVCGWEVAESERLGKRVLPVVCRMVPDAAVPPALSRLNYIFATEPGSRPEALERLVTALETDLGWVREHTRLTEIAQHWADHGRSAAQTLRGADLEEAERWWSHRPTDAAQPTELQGDFIRASRDAARNRQRVLVGGSMVVAVVAVGLAAFAEISRRDAVAQRDVARLQHERADRSLTTAKQTSNTLIVTLAQNLRDEIGMPAPLVKKLIDPAIALQEKLMTSGETDPNLRAGHSHALNLMASTELRLGETETAGGFAQRAVDIARDLIAADPQNAGRQHLLIECLSTLGDVQAQSGKTDAALETYRESLSFARRRFAADRTDETQRDLVLSLSRIGKLFGDTARPKTASAFEDEALSLARDRLSRLTAQNAKNDLVQDAKDDIAQLLQNIGANQFRLGHLLEARKADEEALGLSLVSAPDGAQAKSIALLQQHIAVYSLGLKDTDRALSSIDDAVATMRHLAADKDNADTQLLLASVLYAAGGMRISLAKSPEDRAKAMATLDECLKIGRAVASDHSNIPANVSFALDLLFVVHTNQLSDGQALKDVREALAVFRRLKDGGVLPAKAVPHLRSAEAKEMELAAKSQNASTNAVAGSP